MYGLSSTLQTASQALSAESGAIAVTNSNIANVSTPGYSRQIVSLSPAALQGGGVLQDNGVSFNGFTSVRNQVLQLSINQGSSDAGALNTKSTLWSQIEGAYSGTTTGLGAALSTFFNSFSALSTAPGNAASQQTVLGAAAQVAAAFNQAASALSSAQDAANQVVAGTVTQINQLTSQIASLNQQVTALHNGNQDGGTVEDQRDALTAQLAQLVGTNSIATGNAPTLALTGGPALVSGSTSYPLQVQRAPDGNYRITNGQGTDITGAVSGGSLGGALSMRDTDIPQIQSSLDAMAASFGDAANGAQAQGTDATGAAGTPMFALPVGTAGAAAGISLNLSTISQLALNNPGASGTAGNLSSFLALQNQPLASGFSSSQTYANLVQSVGSASAAVSASLTATNANLQQLQTQQRSESGVSVDEETTNLLRYQQAYSAAAHVISTVNDLFSAVLNMSTVNG